jgi:hypothetical protein
VAQVRRVAGLLAVAALLCAGCKVDARVDVALRADGSGTVTARVTLDADAVHRLTTHAPLDRAVPLDDVRAAGWTVSGWQTAPDGATITLAHDFVGQTEVSQLLAELVGSTGVLRDARLTRSRSWIRAKDSVSVTADLHDLSAGVKSDAQLSSNLVAAGVDVGALDDQLRSQLDQAFTLTLAVHAPDGATKTVTLRAGDQERVAASSTRIHVARVALVIVGAALLVLALVLTAASLVARSRRRRRSSASLRS